MNKEVSFEVKQLLFNKGWRYELGLDETGHRVKHSLAEERWNQGHLNYVDITISDVVMWLYEKHGIWISVLQILNNGEKVTWYASYYEEGVGEDIEIYFDSPTEAYEAAIEYTLNNLI